MLQNARQISLLVGGLLVILLVAGLAAPKPHSHDVTVGVLLPLTGKSASIGERVRAGIEAGVAELRESEGINLQVVVEDDRGDAATAVSAAQKLLSTDRVRIIIGTVKSDSMLAVAPITEASEVILISPTAGASAISEAGDFVFRVIETPNIHGAAAAQRLQGRVVALFVANASNAQSYGAAFKESFGAAAYDTTYSQDESDYRTLIARALAADADAFYLAVATAKDAGLLVKQIREFGFMGKIVASVAADAQEFFDTAGTYANGTIITTSFFDPTTLTGAAFNTRYKTITGLEDDGFSANGYDSVMLVGKAVKRCGEDTRCVRDFLYNTKGYVGAGGTLTFDENGDVTKPVVYKVARDGAFVVEP